MLPESTAIKVARHQLWLSLCDRVLSNPDELAGLNSLTAEERTYYAARRFEGEVNNGGFEQYFFNSAADLYHESMLALKHLGAHESADILERAAFLTFDGEAPPADDNERAERLNPEENDDAHKLCEELGNLDDEFYEQPDNLGERIALFANKHGRSGI